MSERSGAHVLDDLIGSAALPSLGLGSPNREWASRLEALSLQELLAPLRISDPEAAECCRAGALLYVDALDQAHEICQGIDTPEGSYWHAIVHRREADYWNSKYWFRSFGTHPIFEQLPEIVGKAAVEAKFSEGESLAAARWKPGVFVDLCERFAGKGGKGEAFCRAVQAQEMRVLLNWCAAWASSPEKISV